MSGTANSSKAVTYLGFAGMLVLGLVIGSFFL